MSLIQFTRNHSDHSTDKGFQFEFFCDRCGNGFMTGFKASAAGIATSALRAAGSLFGGILGQVGSSSYEIDRLVRGPAHDKAFQEGVEEAKPNFRQCPKCAKWVCAVVCWNKPRGLCYDCAPNVETEIAAAQAQATAEQIREKVRTQDLTKDLNLAGEASALLPAVRRPYPGRQVLPRMRFLPAGKERMPQVRHQGRARQQVLPGVRGGSWAEVCKKIDPSPSAQDDKDLIGVTKNEMGAYSIRPCKLSNPDSC